MCPSHLSLLFLLIFDIDLHTGVEDVVVVEEGGAVDVEAVGVAVAVEGT